MDRVRTKHAVAPRRGPPFYSNLSQNWEGGASNIKSISNAFNTDEPPPFSSNLSQNWGGCANTILPTQVNDPLTLCAGEMSPPVTTTRHEARQTYAAKPSTRRNGGSARPDSDTTVQYAPGAGTRPLLETDLTFGATKGL